MWENKLHISFHLTQFIKRNKNRKQLKIKWHRLENMLRFTNGWAETPWYCHEIYFVLRVRHPPIVIYNTPSQQDNQYSPLVPAPHRPARDHWFWPLLHLWTEETSWQHLVCCLLLYSPFSVLIAHFTIQLICRQSFSAAQLISYCHSQLFATKGYPAVSPTFSSSILSHGFTEIPNCTITIGLKSESIQQCCKQVTDSMCSVWAGKLA